ncbi:MAG: PEP-utilizing enzyme, partial [Clostridia bacterium]|nr:PEP-utilizing enzyme [Clostridia bacterium]
IRDKANQVVTVNEGIKTQPVSDEKRKEKCLWDEAVNDLANQLEKIEESLNQPADIEWTISKGKLYILQARPITTLLPLPDESRDSCNDPVHIYVDFNTVSQGVKEPMTTIGQETQNYYFSEAFSLLTGRPCNYPKWLSFVEGRLYIDLTVFMGRKKWWQPLADKISVKDPSVGEGLMEVMARNESSLKKSDVKFRLPARLPFRIFKHIYLPMVKGFLKGKKYPDSAADIAKKYGDKTVETIQRLFNNANTPEAIIKAIRKAQPIMMKFSFIQYSYCAYGFMAIKKAEKVIKKYQINCDLERIRRSMPTNPTTIMGHEMLELAQFFQQNLNEKLNAHHPNIREFMKRYGHRGNVEMDIGTPRWNEEPETVIKIIQGYMNSSNLAALEKQMKDEIVEAELEISKIYSQICDKANQKTAQKVFNALNDYRKLAGLREQPKFDLMRMNEFLRKQLLIIGEILKKEGRISLASDVAFMNEALIVNPSDNLETLIENNKLAYEQNKQVHHLPPIMTSKGECVYGPSNTEQGLKGYAVAPGETIGRIKKMMKPDAASLEKGDIILTYSTNPSWTPLFILAGGLIMESGGVMSHGSIVAREYGIPAVVLAGSTQLLEDGELVKVDGNSGTIEILENNLKQAIR